jgi:hypothetical protein
VFAPGRVLPLTSPPSSRTMFVTELQKDAMPIPTELQLAIHNALNRAYTWHALQFRKDGVTPYLYHPLTVLSIITDWGVRDAATLQAALLHDVVEENAAVTVELVAHDFGQDVAVVVGELTFIPTGEAAKEVEKAAYMRSFDQKRVEALVTKIADRLANSYDFVRVGDVGYARKYWAKADHLRATYQDRREEVVAHYGPTWPPPSTGRSRCSRKTCTARTRPYNPTFGLESIS